MDNMFVNFIRNNIFTILTVAITAAGAYTTYKVNNALMLRDIEELQKEIVNLKSTIDYDYNELHKLIQRISVLESKIQ